LYQNPRDTAILIKTNLADINNFYIKRISNGKHILQIDSIENFKKVKNLLMKCESKFYIFTVKSEKPIILLLKRLNSSYSENEVLQNYDPFASTK